MAIPKRIIGKPRLARKDKTVALNQLYAISLWWWYLEGRIVAGIKSREDFGLNTLCPRLIKTFPFATFNSRDFFKNCDLRILIPVNIFQTIARKKITTYVNFSYRDNFWLLGTREKGDNVSERYFKGSGYISPNYICRHEQRQ